MKEYYLFCIEKRKMETTLFKINKILITYFNSLNMMTNILDKILFLFMNHKLQFCLLYLVLLELISKYFYVFQHGHQANLLCQVFGPHVPSEHQQQKLFIVVLR